MVKNKQSGGETRHCTPKLKQETRALLCDKDKKELTYSDIKKGLVKYHPDKNPGANKAAMEENYKIINNAKDECFEGKNNTNYTIPCAGPRAPPATAPRPAPPTGPRPTPTRGSPPPQRGPAPKPKAPPKPKPPPTINKNAECVRQVGMISHVAPEFKMDKNTFKPKTMKEELPVVSPKLVALIEKIKELDKADLEKDKQTYKHCIYVDFKGTYAKVTAAAMIAHGFHMAFNKDMKLDEDDLLKTKCKNFAYLSSSTIYGKTMKVPFRKQIVELFNKRPENVHGEYIKYIIIDSGFREGLDLFDTKYCHIIQDTPSPADERQAIGRNTRLCGQAGLKFHPTRGWPLQVYKYDIELTDNLKQRYDAERMYELFLRFNNVDIRELKFAAELDKMIVDVAVDSYLNENIHSFTIKKEKDSGPLLLKNVPANSNDNYNGVSNSSTMGLARLFGVKGGAKRKKTADKANPNLRPKPPLTKKDYPGMYKYVKERFSAYKWPKAKMENQCKMEGGKPQIIKLNETQNFLRQFFQPPSAYKGILLDHSVGSGKCHAKDTPIIMYDGTIKMVQDIQVGDKLMGDDSTPRAVLSLAQGKDDLYDIIPVKGDKYTVNSEHILCLKPTRLGVKTVKSQKLQYTAAYINIKTGTVNGKSFKTKEEGNEFLNKIHASDFIYECPVKDYLNLSKSVKRNLKGYRVSVNFPEKTVSFDPYIIGLWLGDGSKRGPVITSQDATILHYLRDTLSKYNLSLNYQSQYDYRISSFTGKEGTNALIEALKKYKLINNKHIPHDYKINSREVRLQLLAGLIDSDGYADNKGYEITQKNKMLAEDIVFLARSLGYAAYMKECQKSCMYKGEKKTGTYYRTIISGNILHEVPVKVSRKKLEPRTQIKDTAVTGITVNHIGIGDYYGFTLDGNNRYLLGDFTVTHNTCSSIAVASTSWETAGYTILYITRHTLKNDVYKNMFRQVCSQTIKREIQKDEIDIPDGKIKSPSRLLPDAWMQPISFKQLSNACLKKNDVYRELKRRNGEADPFRKTLVIIDEAHKMYANDVIGTEKPDTDAITAAIQNSYRVSGKDSVRLLLMTATPYTTAPMDFMKLTNLMKEQADQLPVTFNDFSEEYLDEDGSFDTGGKRFFANKMTGYISYLNRSNDARQFAYPVFHQELVPMSKSDTEDKKDELYRILRKINQYMREIDASKGVIQATKRRYKERIDAAKEDCEELPRPQRKDCVLETVEPLKEAATTAVNRIKEETARKKEDLKRAKEERKRVATELKNAHKTDMSQEYVFVDKCHLPFSRPANAASSEPSSSEVDEEEDED